ncbi:hypothetical protein HDU76_003769, partial [Blyttiomyces sp. JEL0837]
MMVELFSKPRRAVPRHRQGQRKSVIMMYHFLVFMVSIYVSFFPASIYGLSALPQKTAVIKIGFVGPMSFPHSAFDPIAAAAALTSDVAFVGTLMPLIWLLNKTNFDPNILPTTRIELVSLNSQNDRGVSLKQTLNAIDNQGIVGVIGDTLSSTTVTMAVGAAINNVLH